MKYQNAADLLPPELVRELQQYVKGELLYVPKPRELHEKWGARSGSREEFALRNREIRRRFRAGEEVESLSDEFCLSVESIRRIVYQKEE